MSHFKGVVLASSKVRAEYLAESFGFGEDWFTTSPLILRNGALRGSTIENRVLLDSGTVLSDDTRNFLLQALKFSGDRSNSLQVWGLR